jgi:hypothetical protein
MGRIARLVGSVVGLMRHGGAVEAGREEIRRLGATQLSE